MIHERQASENSYTVSMVGAMDMYEGNAGPFMFIHVTIKPSKFSLLSERRWSLLLVLASRVSD